MVVLFQQYTENICFFSDFSAGGSVIGGDWLFSQNFKEIKHQSFSMTPPKNKTLISDDRGFSEVQTICPKPLSANSRRRENHEEGFDKHKSL